MTGKLQCDICGGKLIGKPGGIFECESCGTEFSEEWAQEKIQEIQGTVKVEGTVQVAGAVKVEGAANKDSLLMRGQMALEDQDWKGAAVSFEQVLNIDPVCAEAYLGKWLAQCEASSVEEMEERLVNVTAKAYETYFQNSCLSRAVQYADTALKDKLAGITQREDELRREFETERKKRIAASNREIVQLLQRKQQAVKDAEEKISKLKSEKGRLTQELQETQGLFSGKKRRELEEKLWMVNHEIEKTIREMYQ